MKKYSYTVLLLFLILLISGYQLFSSDAYIKKANENMDIAGLKFLMEESTLKDTLEKKFRYFGGFGCKVFKNQEDDMEIIFSGFPDVTDKFVLTTIKTSHSDVHFYKIRVGDSRDKAKDILLKNGFNQLNETDNQKTMRFKKRRLNVFLVLDNDSKITRISINLLSTNKKNIIF